MFSKRLIQQFCKEFVHNHRFFHSNRIMSADHLERTSENTRNEVLSVATVIGMRDESKTVKSLTLQVEDQRLSFRAGQWVDMYIPGVETVGGFSMCSSPLKLEREQCMDLAVKYSKHPPAYWIHSKCRIGDQVQIRVGGDFYFDPAEHDDVDLLLLAGGVGINPLYSIINEVVDLQKGDNSGKAKFSGRVMLLYSAKTLEELIFKEQLGKIQKNNDNIMCQFHITGEAGLYTKAGNIFVLGHRITGSDLQVGFHWLRKEKTLVYICGPSHMIEDMENHLTELEVDISKIRYEKWW